MMEIRDRNQIPSHEDEDAVVVYKVNLVVPKASLYLQSGQEYDEGWTWRMRRAFMARAEGI
jgi:hypothetical protein